MALHEKRQAFKESNPFSHAPRRCDTPLCPLTEL